MGLDIEELIIALREMPPEVAIVKISALKKLDGKPCREALDLIRALCVQSKYDLLFVYTGDESQESQIDWLSKYIYKYESKSVRKNMLGKKVACVNSWPEAFAHPFVKGEVKLVITDTLNETKLIYNKYNAQAIYIPRS